MASQRFFILIEIFKKAFQEAKLNQLDETRRKVERALRKGIETSVINLITG